MNTHRSPAHDKNPTVKDVAAAAGVSWKTVSNVVNGTGRVGDETRAHVQQVIKKLGYRPSLAARQLRQGRSRIVGLAVPDIQSPYFARLAHEVMHQAHARSYQIVIAETMGDRSNERTVAQGFGTHLMDGIIFSPLALTLSQADALHADTPMVLLGERPAGSRKINEAEHIAIDDVRAAYDITSHLISSGRTRLAFLGSEPSGAHRSAEPRMRGFKTALNDAGLPYRPDWMIPASIFTREAGVQALTESSLVLSDIDALVCANDLLALGALYVLRNAGIGVPSDIAVTGWDDIEEGAFSNPTLTTVSPDVEALAERAVTDVIARIEHPDEAVEPTTPIPYRIVIRESSGSK